MKNKTVFIFGAGSTAALKIPTSNKQVDIFKKLAGHDKNMLGRLYRIVEQRFEGKNYSINDVYNLIDTALLLKTGLFAKDESISYIELQQAKRELIAHIFAHFQEIIGKIDNSVYKKYVDFYYLLAKRELNDKINSNEKMNDRKFFIADYSIVNFNWDLCSIFPIIEANKRLNHENDRYINTVGVPQLRMYTDFNYENASLMGEAMWYPFTEPAASVANSDKHNGGRRVVLTKVFYPHGLMNSFKCPKCARHSLYLGKELDIKDACESLHYGSDDKLYTCMSCKADISANDFNVLVQSNFKDRNSFLEEIRIKMFCELQSAKRLVFLGYSMPDDDNDYKTFFKSLCNMEEAYVVLYDATKQHGFKKITQSDLNSYSLETRNAIEHYLSAFQKVYVNTQGFPDAVDDILKI